MNKIILCEGKNDVILLSYFLRKVAGWECCKKPSVNKRIDKMHFLMHEVESF